MTEIRVSRTIPGSLFIDYVNDDFGVCKTIPEAEAEALAGFFQAERDAVLGRWRDPENSDVVVYRRPKCDDHHGRCAAVLNESAMTVTYGWERDQGIDESARRYFAAHPEPGPKSWLEAKPGEVWMLTMEGEERPAIVTEDGNFEAPRFLVTPQSVRITAGRRIYPAQDGDNDE
jgi:hypothetical protein